MLALLYAQRAIACSVSIQSHHTVSRCCAGTASLCTVLLHYSTSEGSLASEPAHERVMSCSPFASKKMRTSVSSFAISTLTAAALHDAIPVPSFFHNVWSVSSPYNQQFNIDCRVYTHTNTFYIMKCAPTSAGIHGLRALFNLMPHNIDVTTAQNQTITSKVAHSEYVYNRLPSIASVIRAHSGPLPNRLRKIALAMQNPVFRLGHLP